MEVQATAPFHSQQITWREFYDDSDAESEYSIEGYDPNFLGPPPALESFPRFTEKRPRRKPTTNSTKRDYWVLREAVPHELWYCEYPHCTSYLIPYVQPGVRHHCRACGLTVCSGHCTSSITLSSTILAPVRADPTDSTPVLATSLDPSQLPPVVTLKYACLLCCDKAAAATVKRATKVDTQTLVPTPVMASAVALPDSDGVQDLITALTQVRAQLQTKTQDVYQISGEVNEYRACVDGMKSIIRNLEAQLEVAQTEAKLSATGAKRLRQLRRELRVLTGDKALGGGASSSVRSVGSRAATDCTVASEDSAEEDDGSTDGSSVDHSPCLRSRALSLDGVNEAGHPAPAPALAATSGVRRVSSRYQERRQQQQQQKIPLDPFYAGVVTRACADLPPVTAEDTTPDSSGPVRMVMPAVNDATGASGAAVTEAEEVTAVLVPPLEAPCSVATADSVDSSQLSPLAVDIDSPLPVAPTVPRTPATAAAVPAGLRSPPMFTAAPPSLDITAAAQSPLTTSTINNPGIPSTIASAAHAAPGSAARSGVASGATLGRSASAFVDYADVYSENGECVPAAEDTPSEARPSEEISHPPTPRTSVDKQLSRVMSATPAFTDIYFCPSSEDCDFNGSFGTDQGRFSPRTQTQGQGAVAAHQGDPTPTGMFSFTSATSSVFQLLERDGSAADLREGDLQSLPVRSGALRSSRAPGSEQCSSQDTNDTVATYESLDDLTHSTKEAGVKPGAAATTVDTAGVAAHQSSPGTAARAVEPVAFNPLRHKRKSV